MPERKNTATKSRDTAAGRYCDSKSARGGSRGDDRSKALNDRAANGHGRAQSSADELGRRAWETTYKNRQKSRG
jgi:hypothetical protein